MFEEFCEEHGFDKWVMTSAKANLGLDELFKGMIEKIVKGNKLGEIERARVDSFTLGYCTNKCTPRACEC